MDQLRVIRGSREKATGYLVISIIFVAGALWSLASERPHFWSVGGLIFFGLGAIVFGATIARPPTLVIGPDGFSYQGLGGRTWSVAWNDIADLYLWENPTTRWPRVQRLVAWRYKPGRGKTGALARMSSALGADGSLPSMWTLSPDALLDIFRARWLAAGNGPVAR